MLIGRHRSPFWYYRAMLSIQNLTYFQSGTPLFQNTNLQIFASQRVGLVGKNGCGKSTLFRLIRGESRQCGERHE